MSPDEKVEFLLSLRGAQDLLADPEARVRLLNHLPSQKQNELADRLGQPLTEATLTSAQEKNLLSFFGASSSAKTILLSNGPPLADLVPDYGLFAHQRKAQARTQAVLESSSRRVVLHMPTGAGKTRTAMHLVANHFRNTEPTVVIWLAYNSELLEQAAEEFETAWGSLGNRPLSMFRFWGSGTPDLLSKRDAFIVAGLAKMHLWSQEYLDAFLRLADRTTLTVMDEAHQSTAATYRQLLNGLATKRPDSRLLGLTATPGRTWADVDADRELSAFFNGNKVLLEIDGYENPVDYLMEEGYLARPQFRTLNAEAGLALSNEDQAILSNSLDIPSEILSRLGESEQRNLKIVGAVEELLHDHSRVLVFAVNVDHAKLITATLSARGYEAYCITGETSKPDRSHWIKRFRSNVNRPMALVNFGVLTTGFDAPAASAALIARPTKSLVLFSQMVGRVTRGTKAGGNETCEVVTVVDPDLPGFGSVAEAFTNWEDVWE